MSESVSRRRFLGYAAVAVVCAVVAGAGVYFVTRPPPVTPTPTTPTPTTPPPTKKEPIKIGELSGKTGIGANWGLSMALGTRMAVDEINEQGGVLGRPLEAVIEDTALSATTAVKKAEKMILEDKIACLIGVLSSGITLAVEKVTEKYKIPHFGVVACSEEFRTHNYHDFWFQVHADGRMSGRAIAPWLMENLKPERLLITIQDYSMGWAHDRVMRGILKNVYKFEPVATIKWPLGTRDFTPWFPKIKALKPDCYHLSTWGMDSITQVTQMWQYGLFKHPDTGEWIRHTGHCCTILTTDLPFYPVLKEDKKVVMWYGDLLTQPKYWAEGSRKVNKYNEEFCSRMETLGYGKPNQAVASCYSAVKMWAAAVEEAGTTDPVAVRAVFEEGKKFYVPLGATGECYFRKEDHANIFDVMLTNFQGGKEVVIGVVDGKWCAGKPFPKIPKERMEEVYETDIYTGFPGITSVRWEPP
jgi:branched-chain amino acid transport system substrate-binding protein